MKYNAKSKNTVNFEISDEKKTIAKLIYKSWFKFNAEIEILNSKYQIKPKGFWGTTVEIKDDEKVLLKFTMNWDGNIFVQTYFDDEKNYIFKRQGFFKESFVFTEENGTELLIMKPSFKWKSLNYEYQITTSSLFESLSEKNILLINSLHCANYYMAMMMGIS
ncbi:hypothetical protein AB4Y90_09400 [Chryseobacterium sp. 2TAF14]|uniref:hypothetical protein n=1 Tax=Chryseobacterium sp. 2TAF14 TaxID=3233007 RepID=UPI003F8F1596